MLNTHAPGRRRAPRVPGASYESKAKVLAELTPRDHALIRPCLHDLLNTCDTSFFDEHLRDAHAHSDLAADFLASGVLSQMESGFLENDEKPDTTTSAFLDALRPILSTGTSARQLLLAYEMVLQAGERNGNVFRWLFYSEQSESLVPGLIQRLVHNVWAGHYAGQSRAVLDASSIAPALPIPGDAYRMAQPKLIDQHVSSESLQVWLQYKALTFLYEVLCTVRLRVADLGCIRESFVNYLFDEAEATREQQDETLGGLVTQLLLALHEQYMVTVQGPCPAPFNILAAIRDRPHATRTFAENVVFMLNRTPCTNPAECRFHFLVLKLLDALFAMPETASYFYINDLKVLVDIFLRQITDLAEQCEILRQVYLMVLPSLLTQTQLCTIVYKRDAIREVLSNLVKYAEWSDTPARSIEFAKRCLSVEWCVDTSTTPLVAPIEGGAAHSKPLVEEHTIKGAVYHVETNDAAIHTMLKLGQMQSAAAAEGSHDDFPFWPSAITEQPLRTLELDVNDIEALASGRSSPLSSNGSSMRSTRRKAPPPPPIRSSLSDLSRVRTSSVLSLRESSEGGKPLSPITGHLITSRTRSQSNPANVPSDDASSTAATDRSSARLKAPEETFSRFKSISQPRSSYAALASPTPSPNPDNASYPTKESKKFLSLFRRAKPPLAPTSSSACPTQRKSAQTPPPSRRSAPKPPIG
ncbi:pre-rRNA processing [Malassezia psittaci]|uniref:Pre-rRNA processing n=1 Tax=Malassezia psittaci TaxID=1821823 RepID=A0AAF0FCZ2_9BASI|nr:pre-rRNA processing [Malassezia psittaci]